MFFLNWKLLKLVILKSLAKFDETNADAVLGMNDHRIHNRCVHPGHATCPGASIMPSWAPATMPVLYPKQNVLKLATATVLTSVCFENIGDTQELPWGT